MENVSGRSVPDGLSSVGSSPSVSPVPASIPSADLLTLSSLQYLVLSRMDDELGYPFADIAADVGATVTQVRAVVRQFHAMGLTDYGPLYDEDSNAIRGAGYWLCKPGWELQRAADSMIGWQRREAMIASAMETGTAKTEGLGAKHDSAVAKPGAQGPSS
jgi:hypothetical protein